jgi:hypothetical protein
LTTIENFEWGRLGDVGKTWTSFKGEWSFVLAVFKHASGKGTHGTTTRPEILVWF